MVRSTVRVAPFALALVLIACKLPETKAPAAARLVPPSKEEARQYAEQFIEAVSKPNVARASMMIDWDILLGRATADTFGSRRFRAGFLKGAKETNQLSSYVRQLAKAVEEGAAISLLHVRGDDRERRALLRIIFPNGSVTYNEMLLTRDDQGVVRAADIYAYATGEYVSDAVKRMYKFAIASEPTFMERLQKKKNPAVKSAQMYKEMIEHSIAGRNREAVDHFKRMPADLRKEKSVLVAYVSASSNLGDAQYQSAIEELRNAYPHDPGMDLMLIDGFLLKLRYDDALAAIDRLDDDLGGDPYLDAMRANILLAKRDVEAAHRHALRASVRERTLVEAQWALVNVSLARRDFEETARLLTHIRDELQMEIADLNEIPDYAEFVRSEAYFRWRQ